jgi:hypothetical protein
MIYPMFGSVGFQHERVVYTSSLRNSDDAKVVVVVRNPVPPTCVYTSENFET